MSKTVAMVMAVSSLSLLGCSLLAILLSSLLIKENKKAIEVPCPSLVSGNPEHSLIVKVEQGLLKGRLVESAAGGSYVSFQGVPYAKSPIGAFRFKDAEPPAKWEGIRMASEEGSICPQIKHDIVVGNEDCLFLNIYTPSLSTNKLLPVMVWLHGGAFDSGSGSSDLLGADYLVADGVILVTLNYRLGPLGFFYLREAAPGNAALKDQVAALRWVQRNIAAFRGDPSWMTIFGQSAGAASVHYHMLSPLSKGLFQGAIAQSGIALCKPFMQHAPFEVSSLLSKEVSCLADNDSVTIECMRGISMRTLLKATQRMPRLDKDKHRLLGGPFVPTVDLLTPGVAQFIPSPPLKMAMDGSHHDVPFISGFTGLEGILILEEVNIFNDKVLNKLDRLWREIISPELCFPITESKIDEAMEAIRTFYMNGQQLTRKTLRQFLNLISDLHLQCSFFVLNRMAATRKSIEPIYQYIFTVYDELNAKNDFPKALQVAGHGDDLRYLFHMDRLPNVSPNSSAALARRRMVRLWTNFAKYGKPTLLRDKILEATWHTYTDTTPNVMEIGSVLREGSNPFANRTSFWVHFFQKYGKSMVNQSSEFQPHVVKLGS